MKGTKHQCTLEMLPLRAFRLTAVGVKHEEGESRVIQRYVFAVARLGPGLRCAFFKIFLGATAAQSHGGSTEAGFRASKSWS